MTRFVALSSILLLTAAVGCSDSDSALNTDRAAADGELEKVEAPDGATEKTPDGDDPIDISQCEPCIAGTIECDEDEPTQLRKCRPEGRCWVEFVCERAEDGGERVCDQETKLCTERVCDPVAFDSCKDPKTAIQCNESGTATEEITCENCNNDADFAVDPPIPPTPCTCKAADPDAEPPHGGGCAPLVCRPEIDWACLGDEERHVCNADGTGWVFVEDCNENRSRICEVTLNAEDGQRLDHPTARCISLCEEAQKLKSYIGCEYWAADLDNAFVRGSDPTGYFDAQGKQFAVVISNVSGGNRGFKATVRANRVDGPVWCKTWDPVAGFPEAPNTRYCYENKGACEEGERCEIIIEHDEAGDLVPREICIPHQQGGGTCKDHLEVGAGELRVVNLPRADLNGTMIGPLGYQIISDVPITAYQFNPLENEQVFSNDASLLLPINVLGKDYLVMSREQTFDILRTFVTVVAVRPGDTEVVVRTTSVTLPGPGIGGMQKDQQRRFTLKQFDILNLESRCDSDSRGYCMNIADFTGSEVYANKLIAVFGGSEASNAPNTNHCIEGACWDGSECDTNADCNRNITCCADHLEQQLYPVSTWGQRYVASKSSRRGEPMGTGNEPDVWRILASQDNTTVTTIPHQVNIREPMKRGQWVDFETTEDFEVHADKAILLGQFLAAEHAPGPNTRGEDEPGDAKTGDPAFMLGVPVEQFREDYVILSPDKYEHDFVNVVAPTGSQILFDDTPLPRPDFEAIAEGQYSVMRLQIDDGVHHLRSVAPTMGECVIREECRGADAGCTIHQDCFDLAQTDKEAWKCKLPSDPESETPDIGTCEGPLPKFGTVVYGYDQYVSYGYPGGLNLRRINTCKSNNDCPEGALCCDQAAANAGECVEEESLGECVGR